MIPTRKTQPIMDIMNNALSDLPAPSNISSWWNFGSLLGLCLITQIATGLFLASHYLSDTSLAFESILNINRDVQYGWEMRNLHANGASLFFICLYAHIGRGLYYGSYTYKKTWTIGVILLFLIMATAFVGYVLPWGQMSFWGATVITNLLSAMPYVGSTLVEWIWGGFSVDKATLTRFFAIHFLLPFVIFAMMLLHLLFLHETGSNNPVGLKSNTDKIPFNPYFSHKDILGLSITFILFLSLALFYPNMLADPENFSPANSVTTPPHIKPEWYFLFAYAILRAIPNKLGGVLALVFSIAILLLIPMLHNTKQRSKMLRPMNRLLFWALITNIAILTWIGGEPVEDPLSQLGQFAAASYFILLLIIIPSMNKIEKMLLKTPII